MNVVRTFAYEPGSVRAARRFVSDQLADVDGARNADVTLMVSELASNSIRHAGTGFTVTIDRLAAGIHIEISDQGSSPPTMRDHDLHAVSGRGLRIIDELAERWGIDATPDGNTVWFDI
jgi:anti-sigma regulatory factor (Ser/Thr protein kinase)